MVKHVDESVISAKVRLPKDLTHQMREHELTILDIWDHDGFVFFVHAFLDCDDKPSELYRASEWSTGFSMTPPCDTIQEAHRRCMETYARFGSHPRDRDDAPSESFSDAIASIISRYGTCNGPIVIGHNDRLERALTFYMKLRGRQ